MLNETLRSERVEQLAELFVDIFRGADGLLNFLSEESSISSPHAVDGHLDSAFAHLEL